jgi:hypothetical protein
MSECAALSLVARYPDPSALARNARDRSVFVTLRRLERRGLVRRRGGHYLLTGRGRDELVVMRGLMRLVVRARGGV